MNEREFMEYDVVTVGAGPAGLSFAMKLKQLNPELSVCVIEKSSTIGAHILSGAVIEPGPLDELIPDWRDHPPPVYVPAGEDEFWMLGKSGGFRFPVVPPQMNNHGNYIVSLGAMCAWLAPQAEALPTSSWSLQTSITVCSPLALIMLSSPVKQLSRLSSLAEAIKSR